MSGLNRNTELFGQGAPSFSPSATALKDEFDDLNEKNMTLEMNKTLREIRDSIKGNAGGIAGAGIAGSNLYSFNHGFGSSPNNINTPFEGNVKRMTPNFLSAAFYQMGLNNFYNKEKFRQNPLATKFYNDQLAGDVLAKTGVNLGHVALGAASIVGGTAALPLTVAGGAVLKVAGNNIRSVAATHSDMMATSGGFMYGKADTSGLGLGMSRIDRDSIADMVLKEGYKDKWWDHSDINKLVGTASNNGALRTVRSAEEASEKIKEMIDASKKISTILGESLEGAANELNKMKMIGGYDTKVGLDFSISMERAKKEMGISRDLAYGIMAEGSQQTYSTGRGKAAGVEAAKDAMAVTGLFGSSMMSDENYLMALDDKDRLRKKEEFEQNKVDVATGITKMQNDTIINEEAMMYMLVDKKGSGKDAKFSINKDTLEKLKSGEYKDIADVYSAGMAKKDGMTEKDIGDYRLNKVAVSTMMADNLRGEDSDYAGLRLTLGTEAMKAGISRGEKDIGKIRRGLEFSNPGMSENLLDTLAALIKKMNEGELVKELKESNRRDKLRIINAEYMKETSISARWNGFTKGISSAISDTIYTPVREWNLRRKASNEERDRLNNPFRDEYNIDNSNQANNLIRSVFGNKNVIDKEKRNKDYYRDKTIGGILDRVYSGIITNSIGILDDEKSLRYNLSSGYEVPDWYREGNMGYDVSWKKGRSGGSESKLKRIRTLSSIEKHSQKTGKKTQEELIKESKEFLFNNIWNTDKSLISRLIKSNEFLDGYTSDDIKDNDFESGTDFLKHVKNPEEIIDRVLNQNVDSGTLEKINKNVDKNTIEKGAPGTKTLSLLDPNDPFSFLEGRNISKKYKKDTGMFDEFKTKGAVGISDFESRNFSEKNIFKNLLKENKHIDTWGLGGKKVSVGAATDAKMLDLYKFFKNGGNTGEFIQQNSGFFSRSNDIMDEPNKKDMYQKAIEETLHELGGDATEYDIKTKLKDKLIGVGVSEEEAAKYTEEAMSTANYLKKNKVANVGGTKTLHGGLALATDIARKFKEEKIKFNGKDTDILKVVSAYGGVEKVSSDLSKEYGRYIPTDSDGQYKVDDFGRARSMAGIYAMDSVLDDKNISEAEKENIPANFETSGTTLKKWLKDRGAYNSETFQKVREIRSRSGVKDDDDVFELSREEGLKLAESTKIHGSSSSFKEINKRWNEKSYAEKKEASMRLDEMAEKLGIGKVITLLDAIAENTDKTQGEAAKAAKREKLISDLSVRGSVPDSLISESKDIDYVLKSLK